MNTKIRRPKVKIPAYVKIMSMLSPKRDGKVDRQYIKSMVVAIASYDKHKSDNIKKVYRESSEND